MELWEMFNLLGWSDYDIQQHLQDELEKRFPNVLKDITNEFKQTFEDKILERL